MSLEDSQQSPPPIGHSFEEEIPLDDPELFYKSSPLYSPGSDSDFFPETSSSGPSTSSSAGSSALSLSVPSPMPDTPTIVRPRAYVAYLSDSGVGPAGGTEEVQDTGANGQPQQRTPPAFMVREATASLPNLTASEQDDDGTSPGRPKSAARSRSDPRPTTKRKGQKLYSTRRKLAAPTPPESPPPDATTSSPELVILGRDSAAGGPRPTTRKEYQTCYSIDRQLAKLIRKGPSEQARNSPDPESYNYVAKVTQGKDNRVMYKIGVTSDPERREADLKTQCKLNDLKFLKEEDLQQIRLFRMAESLILMELSNYVIRNPCDGCGTTHHEYLWGDIEETHLLEVHKRWHAFCSAEPWDADGKLKGRYGQRLENKNKGGLPAGCDEKGLAESWRSFMWPSKSELFREEVQIRAKALWRLLSWAGPHWWFGLATLAIVVPLVPVPWFRTTFLPGLWLAGAFLQFWDPEEVSSFVVLRRRLTAPGKADEPGSDGGTMWSMAMHLLSRSAPILWRAWDPLRRRSASILWRAWDALRMRWAPPGKGYEPRSEDSAGSEGSRSNGGRPPEISEVREVTPGAWHSEWTV